MFVDIHQRSVVVVDREGVAADVTHEIASLVVSANGGATVTYRSGDRLFRYGPKRIAVMDEHERVEIGGELAVAVDGSVWSSAYGVRRFRGHLGEWTRVLYRTKTADASRTYRASRVRLLRDPTATEGARATLAYWRQVVASLGDGDPITRVFDQIGTVHPESVLATYMSGEPLRSRADDHPVIYPFSTNVSQRAAVGRALHEQISVVEGPPGTGKTQTILNVIANVIGVRGGTVAVVSSSNTAVDNVREKLEKHGIGFVVASLGRKAKQEEFFGSQSGRDAQVAALIREEVRSVPPGRVLADLDSRLETLQHAQRELARLRAELDALRVEQTHFSRHLGTSGLPDLERLPLLRRSSDRILDYLAETQTTPPDERLLAQVTRHVRQYFRYGSVRSLDPGDAATVLALQSAYYGRRIVELEGEVSTAESFLAAQDVDALVEQHSALSQQILRGALHRRYAGRGRTRYDVRDYRARFTEFVHDYPVVLSTCHSLRANLPQDRLLDLVIIDEASQVGLLEAVAVLGSCRNVVVVGDLQQLQQITKGEPGDSTPPLAAYDYHRHNILSSLVDLYADALPRTLLREHYRCDPQIIGFCNAKFYDGALIPFRPGDGVPDPLVVVRTPEGNHMRWHTTGEHGRSNQREVDVIREEILPRYCPPTDPRQVGITTPYRRQVSKLVEAFPDLVESDTVHGYQGREKDLIIMSTVLDETRDGHGGIGFVDDPRMVNVAVSRARKRFVLVTNHDMLPRSRNLRDLIDYVLYQDPDQRPVDSAVVSIFDLLYKRYSERLRPIAAKMRPDARFRSEEACRVVLDAILAEPDHQGLDMVSQVRLRNLVTRPELLDPEQRAYVARVSSVDFVVYSSVSRRAVLAVEVDGFAFHENDEKQTARDVLKDAILERSGLPLLRLRTTESGEPQRIRAALAAALSRQLAP